MPTVDERLASLEARIDRMNDLQNLIAALRDDMNRQFDQTRADAKQLRDDVNRQFEQTRADANQLRDDMNRQFERARADTNRQFEQARADTNQLRADMIRQFDQMNGHMTARLEQLDHRIDTVDRKADRHFTWLVGLQMTVMLAVIGALLGAYLR